MKTTYIRLSIATALLLGIYSCKKQETIENWKEKLPVLMIQLPLLLQTVFLLVAT
jgi:hypothetical protein